jgi:peptidoglycan/LPS O-acetylase OafA/YrhL
MNPAPSIRLHGLDTLRAFAILVVIVFHLESFLPPILAPIANLGWMGVDLFFVLSGFLIGSQLLKPLTLGQPLRLADFWLRRAFRILPAYLTVLALYLAIPIWREHPQLPAAWKFLSFTQNLIMVYPAELAFSHAWSLCVEEHFYLVLPILVVLFTRRPAFWKTTLVIASVFLGGILLRAFILFHIVRAPNLNPNLDPDQSWILFMKFLYYPTYTRLDGLLAGVTLACIRTFRPRWWLRFAARGNTLTLLGLLVSAAAILSFHAAYVNSDDTTGVLFGFPTLAIGFTLLVAAALAENGPMHRRIPGAKPLATLAFSLYLSHKGVAHIDHVLFPTLTQDPTWRAALLYAATCLAFATLLYLCVERPFLLLRDHILTPTRTPDPALEARLDPAL